MTDLRLIEDYIPIEAVSNEVRREKSIPQRAYLDPAPVVDQATVGGGPRRRVWRAGPRFSC